MIFVDALIKKFDMKKMVRNAESEPEWLKSFRISSLKHFRETPIENSELFRKYVNLDGIDWDSFNFSHANSTIPDEFRFLLSENRRHAVCCDSRLVETIDNKDIVFTDIMSAIGKYPDMCREYFSVPKNESKFVAFNNAFFDSGFLLYVPDNRNIKIPLRIVNVFTQDNSLGISKNIIIIGKNSSVTLGEEEYSSANKQSLINTVASMHLKAGAELRIGNIHSLGDSVIRIMNRNILLEKDAKIFCSSGFFGGAKTLSYSDYMLKGDTSSADSFDIVFGNSAQNFSVSLNMFHEGMNTRGRAVSKGVFCGKSKGLLRGIVDIGKRAKDTNSFLSNHSILLSKDARSDAIPGLQIRNNDVKATHSASVTQINEDQIFYLMSRGFSENEAKKLIVSGFFEPIIRQSPKNVSDIIRGLLEIKWNNQELTELRKMVGKIPDNKVENTGDMFEGHYKYR